MEQTSWVLKHLRGWGGGGAGRGSGRGVACCTGSEAGSKDAQLAQRCRASAVRPGGSPKGKQGCSLRVLSSPDALQVAHGEHKVGLSHHACVGEGRGGGGAGVSRCRLCRGTQSWAKRTHACHHKLGWVHQRERLVRSTEAQKRVSWRKPPEAVRHNCPQLRADCCSRGLTHARNPPAHPPVQEPVEWERVQHCASTLGGQKGGERGME